MTDEEEALALPIVDGSRVLTPTPDDYAVLWDRQGMAWSTGLINGVRYRQRNQVFDEVVA